MPVRMSSMANSPLKSRDPTDRRAGLPLTTSDLADTIAGLKLTDDPARPPSLALSKAIGLELDFGAASIRNNLDGQTPLALSAPFAPASGSPVYASRPTSEAAHSLSPSEQGFQQADLFEIGEQVNDAREEIELIQAHIFSIQEQRHGSKTIREESPAHIRDLALDTGKRANVSNTEGSPTGPPLRDIDLSLMQLDERLESMSRTMQQLEVRLVGLQGPPGVGNDADAGDSSIIDKEMSNWQARARRNSIGSIDSLGALDDLALPGFAPAMTPRSLRAKYDQLCLEWTTVQQEVDALKKELADDKYLDVFRSISTQAEGMMDSLDKAVALCHTFVQQVQRDHLAGRLHKSSATEDVLDGDYDMEAKHEELAALTKTFGVKKLYYLPACQQVFHSLEKGCKERQTANGTILRRLSDLRSRWRNLRDELSKTERDLKRIEVLFRRVRSDSSGSSITNELASPATSVASLPPLPSKLWTSTSVQSGLGFGTPARASAALYRNTPSPSPSSRVASGPSRLSSSSSMGSSLSNTPPAAGTPQRLRRTSATAESLGMHKVSTPPNAGSARQLEVPRTSQRVGTRMLGNPVSPLASGTPLRNRATSTANAATGAVEKGVLGRTPAARPMSMIASRNAAGGPEVSGSPSRPPPSSFKQSWHGLERQDATPSRAAPAQSMTRSQSQVMWPSQSETSKAEADKDDSIEYLKCASGSSPARPSSSAGQYYRPPSAQGTVGEAKSRKRDSMIPRLAVRSWDVNTSPNRPGSALSQASISTPARYTGASRSSMQTPEPAIVARAQRLSMYARAPSTGIAGTGAVHTPTKRASKPPPARRNAALASGRATPLSAAALASLPAAEPGASLKRSSVSNLRSLNNGRTTPTFSDNGSVGAMSTGTWYGPGRVARGASGTGPRLGSGSVAGSSYGGTGAIELYRANPNDTLDVEVAAICNGLGVALDRIDPPQPRGVRLEEGPGKDNRAQYEIGGRKVMCRLLELHRPAGSAGARAGSKAKKILVRVGGGWQDLEQWLLGRLSSI